ncbi:MAG: ABC transporter substrate-binding protein [Gammaproteobacteria bacterium]|nr:ABC transporter substrate-binding protein [Gammaproteobacteria bacterium]
MRKVATTFLFLLVWSTATLSLPNLPPDQLVRETTEKVIAELERNREEYMGDGGKLYALVNDMVLPYFDFERMSRLVLGKHWRGASASQQEQFVDEFKALLVRTYATALLGYTGQEIVYKPVRFNEDDIKVVVKTELQPGGGPNVPLHYSLRKSDDGSWKVFDINIDGISLVTNYRSAYAQVVRTKGLNALIESLAERNKEIGQ